MLIFIGRYSIKTHADLINVLNCAMCRPQLEERWMGGPKPFQERKLRMMSLFMSETEIEERSIKKQQQQRWPG